MYSFQSLPNPVSDSANAKLYHREVAHLCPSILQRSRFVHMFQKDGAYCLFHALTLQMVYGGRLLYELYSAFAKATPVDRTINRCSANHPLDATKQAVADMWQNALLIQGPDEDVQAYRSLCSHALNRYSIRHMYLLMTTTCNFRCKYCFIEDDQRHLKPYFMDTDIAEKALTVWAKLSKKSNQATITFYGGEPLLNPKVTFFALRFLRQVEAEGVFTNKVRATLLTNGSLIDSKAIRVFQETRPNIGVSIDGPQALHDAGRVDEHGHGTFDVVLAGYKRLQDAGLKPSVSCTLSGFTIPHMDEIVDFIIDDLRPKGVGFNLLLPRIGKQIECAEMDHDSAVHELIRAFRRLREAGIYEDRMMRRIRPFIEQRPHLKDCMGVGGQLVVTPTGRIGPCQAFMGVDDKKYFPLDVRQLAEKSDLLSSATIYAEPLFDEWRHRFPLNMSQCADCFAISVCGGGCPYAAAVTNGCIWGTDQRICFQAKTILKWMIWDTYEHMRRAL